MSRNGAHARARDEAERGKGPPRARSRGVGRSPTRNQRRGLLIVLVVFVVYVIVRVTACR